MGKKRAKPQEFLDQRLDKTDECWIWTAHTDRNGYGQCTQVVYGQSIWLAHRLAWVLANKRPVPDEMKVLHSCDNPPCCNPTHLHLGTQLDNMREMRERGRSPGIPLDQPLPPSPGMARLIADYNRNKARRIAREKAKSNGTP